MKIFPREEIYGVFSAPSDRAVTQRAIILGSIAKGKTYVVRPLMCADTTATIGCVRKLGAKVKVKGDIIEIRGAKTVNDETRLDCGNSGLAMRLLCGVVAGSGLNAVVTGDKYLLKRSMKNVKEPLEMMGATVALTNYTVAPIRVEGEKVRPIDYEMQYPSSQVKSAVLLAALTGGVKATVKEPVPTKDHTEILLKEMGADITIDKENSTVTLNKSELYGKRIYISGDFSSAAYLLALGTMLGKVTVKNVGVNPTRIAIIHVLRKMGARIEIRNKRILCGELIADVTAYKSKLTATHVTAYDMSKMSGTLSVLAVLMGLAEGESIIGGEAYPNPEKNARLDYICEAICALGGNCRKINGGIVIRGVEKYRGGNVKSYGDHSVALAAAVALMASSYGGELDGEDCVEVSFPGFFDKMKKGNIAVFGKGMIADSACKTYYDIMSAIGESDFACSTVCANDEKTKKIFSELKTYDGFALYAPYTQEITRYSPKYSGIANIVKSVNFSAFGKAYSTDGAGVIAALAYNKTEVAGKSVLVLGAGSSGRSVIAALAAAKAKVSVYNRNYRPANEISKRLKGAVRVYSGLPDEEYDIIINATSLGSGYYEDQTPAPEELIEKCSVAVDLGVAKKRTEFISLAQKHGKKRIDGETVAFFVAYYSVCEFLGRQPTVEEASALYKKRLAEAKAEKR